MAVPEDKMSVIIVSSSMNIEALSSVVLNVSDSSGNPSDLVLVDSTVWSDSSSNSNSEALANLVGNAVGSLGVLSDGVGS